MIYFYLISLCRELRASVSYKDNGKLKERKRCDEKLSNPIKFSSVINFVLHSKKKTDFLRFHLQSLINNQIKELQNQILKIENDKKKKIL